MTYGNQPPPHFFLSFFFFFFFFFELLQIFCIFMVVISILFFYVLKLWKYSDDLLLKSPFSFFFFFFFLWLQSQNSCQICIYILYTNYNNYHRTEVGIIKRKKKVFLLVIFGTVGLIELLSFELIKDCQKINFYRLLVVIACTKDFWLCSDQKEVRT